MNTLLRRPLVPNENSQADSIPVTEPFSGKVIEQITSADWPTIDLALTQAQAAFNDRNNWLPPLERIRILRQTADLIEEDAEYFSMLIAREGGKPLVDARVEVSRAVDGLRGCTEILRTQGATEIPMNLTPASTGRLAVTRREPVGPVAAISAFNHPLNLAVHQIGPAIAAGCPVIVKPAEATPLSCFHLVELLHKSGLPPAWCQAFIVSDLALASRFASDSRVKYLSFIGSANVGWSLRAQLAHGTRCVLEHGGAAPVIVTREADLDAVIPGLTKAGFYHAGQVCVSVQRIFAHRDIAERLAQVLAEKAQQLTVGDPTSPETDVGPMIRPTEVDRVETWINEAIEEGARCLCGGERLNDRAYACTVLFDPDETSKVSQKEIFGPVVCVYPYDTLEEAIDRANALPFTFQTSIFTPDINTAMHAFRHLRATAVMINDHTAFRVDWMPFGGRDESGIGIGGIPYSFRDMQNEKLLVIQSPHLAP